VAPFIAKQTNARMANGIEVDGFYHFAPVLNGEITEIGVPETGFIAHMILVDLKLPGDTGPMGMEPFTPATGDDIMHHSTTSHRDAIAGFEGFFHKVHVGVTGVGGIVALVGAETLLHEAM